MLGSVYAHIFGEANARREVYELSRRAYEQEDPEFDVDEWVAGAHPLDDHALEHPLVTELVAKHETGAGAALAYMEDMEETDVAAVIRWMTAGAYKGFFETEAAFCEDEFCEPLEDQVGNWGLEVGFPHEPVGDLMDWGSVAYWTFDGVQDTMRVFSSVTVEEGVYVFKVSIDIGQYRG